MTIVQVAQKTDKDCRLLSMYTADHSVLKQKKEKNDDDDVDDNDSDSDGSDCQIWNARNIHGKALLNGHTGSVVLPDPGK